MAEPKISVLIPMYNRKHYISDCIDSALNQTFQDFEIIVRDDGSTDGSFDFVKEKYAAQIPSGKIKLFRNEKNLGEYETHTLLFKESSGKYLTTLHCDDMYLPNALQHLYEVAEKYDADVVHSSYFLNSPKDGIIKEGTKLRITCWESRPAKNIEVVSDNPILRFKEWIEGGTFIDAQYNMFKRNFVLDNKLFSDGGGHRYVALWWIMGAKILVKTPVAFYIRRDAPDSQSNAKTFSPEKVNQFISNKIELSKNMDKRFSKIEFFRDNEIFQYMAKAHLFSVLDNYAIRRRRVYEDGITPALYEAVADAFRKHFGKDYFYPMFLFNWAHVMPFNHPVEVIQTSRPAATPPFRGADS